MYHYTESGLQNVYLENGYKTRKTEGGVAIAIMNVEGLHKAIGRELATSPHLTGTALRFLRKELGLSQHRLGEAVGASVESVSLWERKGRMPKSADRIVRALYLEHLDGNAHITALIQRLVNMDNQPEERLVFSDTDNGWRMAA